MHRSNALNLAVIGPPTCGRVHRCYPDSDSYFGLGTVRSSWNVISVCILPTSESFGFRSPAQPILSDTSIPKPSVGRDGYIVVSTLPPRLPVSSCRMTNMILEDADTAEIKSCVPPSLSTPHSLPTIPFNYLHHQHSTSLPQPITPRSGGILSLDYFSSRERVCIHRGL